MQSSLKHLAIIPDGNRRWARARGLPTLEGHRRGYDRFLEIGDLCLERGIEYVSFWGFSTENWKRSAEEVAYLWDLILLALTKEVDKYVDRGIRMKVIGRRSDLKQNVLDAIIRAEQKTAGGTRGQVNLCVNYGGRAEIVEAVQKIVADGRAQSEITEDLISSYLWTAGIPEPDLIVRTSGEQRLSGFQSWAGAYSELYFTQKHWPDFDEAELDLAIEEFSSRQRRFGK